MNGATGALLGLVVIYIIALLLPKQEYHDKDREIWENWSRDNGKVRSNFEQMKKEA